jgi:hypothetical protein
MYGLDSDTLLDMIEPFVAALKVGESAIATLRLRGRLYDVPVTRSV